MCAGTPLTGCTTAPEEPGRMEGLPASAGEALQFAQVVSQVAEDGGDVRRQECHALFVQHVDRHDEGDIAGAVQSAVDFGLGMDALNVSVSAALFAVGHDGASSVSCDNSPSEGAKLGVARRTGLALPVTLEPGPPESGPVRPAIMRKGCGSASHVKKPLARLCANVISGVLIPAPVL